MIILLGDELFKPLVNRVRSSEAACIPPAALNGDRENDD